MDLMSSSNAFYPLENPETQIEPFWESTKQNKNKRKKFNILVHDKQENRKSTTKSVFRSLKIQVLCSNSF